MCLWNVISEHKANGPKADAQLCAKVPTGLDGSIGESTRRGQGMRAREFLGVFLGRAGAVYAREGIGRAAGSPRHSRGGC